MLLLIMDLRSHCPINFALEHIGDKWSLLIIRDLMFKRKRHYNEFLEAEENVSTSVLGDRLKSLEKSGLISKGEDSVKKSRIRYSLTEKGIGLLPMITEMILWSSRFDSDGAVDQEFVNRASLGKAAFLAELQNGLLRDHINS